MGSPLKRPGNLARLATQLDTRPMDYDAIARTVDSSIDRFDRRQKSFREERRQQKLDQARDYRLAMLKAEQQKGLMIDSNSGYSSIDDYFRQAGRGLADEASNLVSQLSNNEITSDEFAQRYSTISSQVDQLKPFAAGLKTMMTNYRTDLANGTLSAANQDMYENLYEAISQDKGNLFLDDNGVLVYQGETAEDADGNTEPFSIPINQLAAVPQPIKKVDPFPALTKTIADTLSVPTEMFDPATGKTVVKSTPATLINGDFSSGVRGAFDDFVKVQGNNGLKSLAMDHLGYDMERMQAMLDSGPYTPTADDFSKEDKKIGLDEMEGERFSSQLEFEMEKEFIRTAADQTRKKELQSKLQWEINYKNRLLEADRQKAILTAQNQRSKALAGGSAQERLRNETQNIVLGRLQSLGFGYDPKLKKNLAPDFSDPKTLQEANKGSSVKFSIDEDGTLIADYSNGPEDYRNRGKEPIKNTLKFMEAFGIGNGLTLNDLKMSAQEEKELMFDEINFNKSTK